jgi:hypothetical protein
LFCFSCIPHIWENTKQLNEYFIEQFLANTSIDRDCCSMISEYLTHDRLNVGDRCWLLNARNLWCDAIVEKVIHHENEQLIENSQVKK